jgi:thermitase
MATISYYSHGRLHRLNTTSSGELLDTPEATGVNPAGKAMVPMAIKALQMQADRLEPLIQNVSDANMQIGVTHAGRAAIIPTPTLFVAGTSKSQIKKLVKEFGLEVIEEGSEGKVLLRAPEAGEKGVDMAAAAARKAYTEGYARIAHPNFIRVMRHIKPSAAGGTPMWNHANDGGPGVIGADVAALAAWTITRGDNDIRIAVLDEGVDTKHPALKAATVTEKDFVGNNRTAKPDGDDAHGTACAGIIVSRSTARPGLAPECSLVAVRIAKGDGGHGWVFDDYKTADSIDWAWREGKADVLSNSWGGGPPVDGITASFNRARTKGRGNKGAVIVVATGNENGPVGYPATLSDVLAVGASNSWDERKSPTSKDGESWWGSNYGPEISLLAPGVRIATTDIRGTAGYTSNSYVENFNGTSSAAPHVAAAAALLLSVRPNLTEKEVRKILTSCADRLADNGKWDKYVGWGRLNIYSALRMARR